VPFLGAMAGEVRLAGPMDAMRVDLSLQGPRGALSGGGTVVLMAPHLGARDLDLRFTGLELLPIRQRLPRTAFSGTVTGMVEADTLVPTRLDVALTLGPSRVGGTLVDSVRAGLRMQEGVLAIDTLRAWLRGVGFSGSGGLGLRAPDTDTLVLRLEADSVAALAPLVLSLAGRDTLGLSRDTLRGAVAGTVMAVGALDALDAMWSVGGGRVDWNALSAYGARAHGQWSSAAAGRVNVQVEVDSLRTRDRSYDGLLASATGSRDSLRWIVRSGLGPFAAVRGGGVWVRRGSWEVRPDSLVLETAGERWTLADGAAVRVTDSTIGLRGVTLATGSGRSRLTLSGTVPRTGAGRFDGAVEGLPLSHVWALLQRNPEGASGLLSGTFRVGGTARDPVIDVSFSLRDAVFDEFRAPLTDGTVAYQGRRLTGTLNMWRSGVRVLGIDVELPLDLGFVGVERRRLPGPLSIRARADGVDLALLAATSPLIRQTEGRLWADVGLTGEWERPELTGFVEVRDGAATFPALGVRHRQLNGRLTLSGDSIRVDSLSAWSGPGHASVRGVIRLEALTHPVLDLTLEAAEFRGMDDPEFLTLTASGTLELTGPVVGAVLRGSGTVTRGALHFADIIEKDLVNLDPLTVDSATAAIIRRQRLGPDFESRFLDSLRIENLRLQMGADVHLRSTEADILLSGEVLVGKVADRYRIDGTLRTPRGTYDLYLGPVRRRFNVTRGEVRYFGTPDLNAALDIDARHQLRGARGEDVTVFVHVGGTILEPELRLSSDVRPTLSDAEVINYLVFGAPNAQAIAGNVGAYYGQETLTSLTGQISGQFSSALIADLGIPLDYLEFRPQLGQSGTAAEISGGLRLSDRVFVTVSPRFCRQQAFTVQNLGGTVEFQLGSGWSLLASADPVRVCNLSGTAGFGQQLQLGLDLFWERRF
ncbi:MAG TPA: translocation/assembly module TamB domain-containing protein, partial [Gemmatimonadales bacterium]|nr:translocation/assembly module TamB domain-containing protein [Gemmatimonadales bacterium]